MKLVDSIQVKYPCDSLTCFLNKNIIREVDKDATIIATASYKLQDNKNRIGCLSLLTVEKCNQTYKLYFD